MMSTPPLSSSPPTPHQRAWGIKDVVVHNFLYPSLQQALVREIREDLQKSKTSLVFDPTSGTKVACLFGKQVSDLIPTIWIEFFREMLWSRSLDQLPNRVEIRHYPQELDLQSNKGTRWTRWDEAGMLILLGSPLLIRRETPSHDNELRSGAVMWIQDLDNRVKVVGRGLGSGPEGLLAPGVSLTLAISKKEKT